MRSAHGPSLVFMMCLLSMAIHASGCKRRHDTEAERKPQPRLVMLNVFCTLGKDMLEPYDPNVDYTPNLARFARKGVVFERHVTESGQSGIAFASILSGEHAMRHEVYSHPTRLPDAIQTLPEAFAEAGYDTFFWERQSMASIELNYGQGVEAGNAFGGRYLVARDPKFTAVLRRLAKDPSYKAFIVSFYSVTHSPYPKASLEAFCAQYPDHCKGIDPRKADPALADVQIGEGQASRGRDLFASFAERQAAKRAVAFSHTSMWPTVATVQRQPHFLKYHPGYNPALIWALVRADDLVVKYRADGKGEFFLEAFDMARDPDEEHDIFDPDDPVQRSLAEQLDRYRRALIDAHVDPRTKAPEGPKPDDETLIEQLRALGYID